MTKTEKLLERLKKSQRFKDNITKITSSGKGKWIYIYVKKNPTIADRFVVTNVLRQVYRYTPIVYYCDHKTGETLEN